GRVKLEIPDEEIGKIFVIQEVDPTPIPDEISNAVVPWVWETGTPGKSKAAQPVVIELKQGAKPVRIKQYPIKLEARRGVAPVIAQFVIQGLLKECESEYNTPIFPVRKPNGKYKLVQDLRAINEIVKDIHLVVANPYTLLTSVSEQFEWFTVIDLKDAFFCIPLAIESINKVTKDELVHDCVEMIEQVYSSRQDLKDEPLDTADWELFTDGSSFVENGTRYAGYSVVTVFQVIEARALTPGTSAQKAEIIGLTRALILSTGRKVNIWTDSKYAFGVVHIHGALWRERGLLSSQGTAIKHREEVVALLDAVHKPEQVAVMHVRGHQKEDGKIFRGNQLADAAAREAARQVWTPDGFNTH
ncbi:hypothetical protein DV515_00019268, partial [Chloebia gouldiae]